MMGDNELRICSLAQHNNNKRKPSSRIAIHPFFFRAVHFVVLVAAHKRWDTLDSLIKNRATNRAPSFLHHRISLMSRRLKDRLGKERGH